MVESKHLRIGNLVQDGDVVRVVESITPTGINFSNYYEGYSECDISYISGIPITEEWLERSGFNKNKDKYVLGQLYINSTFSLWYEGIDETGEEFELCYVTLKYVHQLQNLYFVLKGEELTIQE